MVTSAKCIECSAIESKVVPHVPEQQRDIFRSQYPPPRPGHSAGHCHYRRGAVGGTECTRCAGGMEWVRGRVWGAQSVGRGLMRGEYDQQQQHRHVYSSSTTMCTAAFLTCRMNPLGNCFLSPANLLFGEGPAIFEEPGCRL
jgi:hypothetical protein